MASGGLALLVALYFYLTLILGACSGPSCSVGADPLAQFRLVTRALAWFGTTAFAGGMLLIAPFLRASRSATGEQSPSRAPAPATRAAAVTLGVVESRR